MKPLLFSLPLALLISCTHSIYHVASLQSEQVKPIEKDFIYENEHLKVIYNLWAEDGRMRYLLFNKTQQPLYIDWTKSFLERNGAKTSYSQLPALPKKSPVDTLQYRYQNVRIIPYQLTARDNRLAEIPSQIYVAIADLPIQSVIQHLNANVKTFTYSKSNSPLRIKHQLAYSFDKTLTDPHRIDHSFWVTKIDLVRAGDLPKLYGSPGQGQPNTFYSIEKRPSPGGTLAVVGVSLAAATGATLYFLSNLNILIGFSL